MGLLLSDPAPVENAMGSIPKMVDTAVMSTGLKRRRDAWTTLSTILRPSALQLIGKLNDQNAVFGGESDKHNQANLAVEVNAHSRKIECTESTGEAERNGHQDSEGVGKTFKLGSQC